MLTYIFSLNFITRVLQGALVGVGAILLFQILGQSSTAVSRPVPQLISLLIPQRTLQQHEAEDGKDGDQGGIYHEIKLHEEGR